ncbi:MAG: tetratricopeptide repeat protein [Polyangiaceae bacterium]|nr:tetratricopeptide repeat protein [Polyangiaceae bacterium]
MPIFSRASSLAKEKPYTRRFPTLPLGAFLSTLAAIYPNSSRADEVCISPAAKTALTQCPAGVTRPVQGKKKSLDIKAPPPPAATKTNATTPREPDPTPGKEPRGDRWVKAQARNVQLLITEIQQLETLFQATPQAAPDRPGLLRRLSDTYVELEAASFRTRTEVSIKIDAAKKNAPGDVAKLTAERDKADKVLNGARKAAIKYYEILSSDHPKYCTHPNSQDPAKSTGCADEVLYYLAYEHEQAGDMAKARKVYLQLITQAPKSPFVAGAYLAFGELYFAEAQSDPSKWPLAAQAYSEVVKYPLPDNKFYAYAQYKLAYVLWNQTDYSKALSAFKRTIETGQQYPTLPNASALAAAARRDMVVVYALSGLPKKAYDFVKPLSGDSGVETEKTFKWMDDLGHAYLDTGHYKEGIELYQDLLSRDKGPRQCLYQARITEATVAEKSANKDEIVAAITKQVESYEKQKAQRPTQDQADQCANSTAEVVAETAMAWHLESVGSGGVRGTGDKKTMAHAAELYDLTLKTFDKQKFATLAFPKILKEDWPTRSKLAYLRADLLYTLGDWAKCGSAFDTALAEDPTGPDAAPAAYAGVLCRHRIYLQTHQNGSDRTGNGRLVTDAGTDLPKKLAPKEFSAPQKEMVQAFDRYLCYIEEPKESEKESREEYIDIKFARARMYFEAQRWEEAAYAFREIALAYPNHDAALPAAQLYLESANVLAGSLTTPRAACFDDMGKDVPTFVQTFCTGGKEKTNASDCAVLSRVSRGLEGKIPEATAKAAEGMTGAAAMKTWEKAAQGYFSLWKKYGEPACREKADGCAGNEAVLYNAARAFQAARLLARAVEVRKILIDPQYNLHRTEPAKKAVYDIGANYQAIAMYEDAAAFYERFAAESPTLEKAADALQDAIVLRLGLGNEKQALADAELFTRTFGSQKPAQAARISLAIATHLSEKNGFAGARKRLSDSMASIDSKATLDVQIQAHSLLGHVYDRLGLPSQAVSEHNRVKSGWANPELAVKKLTEIYPDEGERLRHLAKTLSAVGRSLFFFAEQKKLDVDKIKFPEYKGSGAKDDVLRHVNTKVMDWAKKKRAAIDVADIEYRKIANLLPSAPPKWTVASAARVGQMLGKFVAEFRAAPIPKEWKQNGPHPTIPNLTWEEIRFAYYEALDRASEPHKLQAKAAYETCLKTSVNYQHFDEYSRACEVWLSKNYGHEYHLVDELRGAPSRVAQGLGNTTQPVAVGGSFVRPETEVRSDVKSDAKPDGKADGKSDPNANGTADPKSDKPSALKPDSKPPSR